jgi:hypothetical protein
MASVIRDYIAAVRTATGAEIDPALHDAWSQWALAEANRLDPIKAGRSIAAIQAGAGAAAGASIEEGDDSEERTEAPRCPFV